MDKFLVIALLNIPSIGRKTAKFIMDNYKINDKTEFVDVIKETKIKKNRIKIPNANDLDVAFKLADEIIVKSEKNKIKIITYGTNLYPIQLKKINDPPVILYAKGNMECLNENAVAIIGTREPTNFSKKSALRLGELFFLNGFNIVSGLAIGCDTFAHEGCLKVNGKTIAVLANGLDQIYPTQNIELANKILSKNGCLISEYPIETKPVNINFAQRDRLQSGLSKAVIVIETGIKGGTMQTVKYCLDQNRILGCISHPENMDIIPNITGNQMLINENKAIPIKDSNDLKQFIEKINAYVEKDNKDNIKQLKLGYLD